MSPLLVILLASVGVTVGTFFYLRRKEEIRIEKFLQDNVNMKKHQEMLDSPYRPKVPDFLDYGDGRYDEIAHQRARDWDTHQAELRRKRLAKEQAETELRRRKLRAETSEVEHVDRYNVYGMGYANAGTSTPDNPGPKPLVGGGGTFDGGGASGDWDRTPSQHHSTPSETHQASSRDDSPSYSSPSSDSGSSDSGGGGSD